MRCGLAFHYVDVERLPKLYGPDKVFRCFFVLTSFLCRGHLLCFMSKSTSVYVCGFLERVVG